MLIAKVEQRIQQYVDFLEKNAYKCVVELEFDMFEDANPPPTPPTGGELWCPTGGLWCPTGRKLWGPTGESWSPTWELRATRREVDAGANASGLGTRVAM
jgi:hypothetical protein